MLHIHSTVGHREIPTNLPVEEVMYQHYETSNGLGIKAPRFFLIIVHLFVKWTSQLTLEPLFHYLQNKKNTFHRNHTRMVNQRTKNSYVLHAYKRVVVIILKSEKSPPYLCLKTPSVGTSLVVQWLRIHVPMQGT